MDSSITSGTRLISHMMEGLAGLLVAERSGKRKERDLVHGLSEQSSLSVGRTAHGIWILGHEATVVAPYQNSSN